MADKKKTIPTLLWMLSGAFYFVVILLAVAGLPDINIVPTISTTTATVNTVAVGKVNINTATVTELCALPGVGEVLAMRIIEYREQHGAFADITELKNVSGIGDKKWEAICEFITV